MFLSPGYTTEQKNLAELSKVLAHPARMALLQAIVERKTCAKHDFIKAMNISPSELAKHIRILQRADVINGTLHNGKVSYCINLDKMKLYKTLVDGLYERLELCVPELNCMN